MERIEDVSVGPMPADSPYIKPLRMTYTQNGKKKFWDIIKLHNSVSCILFNRDRNVLVFVKQFRPSVYYSSACKESGDNEVQEVDFKSISVTRGFTLELCAGIVDQPKLSLKEIVQKEVLEEVGYQVPLENFQKVISYRAGVGANGDIGNMFYAEISDAMKVNSGGGSIAEGEMIEVVEMSIGEVREYINGDNVLSPGGFLFGVMWFLANKAPANN